MRNAKSSWAFDRSFQTVEYPFRVQTDTPEVGTLVESLLEQFSCQEMKATTYRIVQGTGENPFRLSRGRRNLNAVATVGGSIQSLLWQINSEVIRNARRHLLIHAAAASWRGRGIVMPAESESGKTTLVTGLIRAGFDYLSDEAAVIDPKTLSLIPYAKPLSMEAGTLEAIPELKKQLHPAFAWTTRFSYHLHPSDVRTDAIGSECAVKYVIAPSYRRGETAMVSMSRADALVALVDNAFNFNRFGTRGLKALARVVERTECFRLRMGDVPSAVEAILDVVGQ
jgi:hypothetical protein